MSEDLVNKLRNVLKEKLYEEKRTNKWQKNLIFINRLKMY